MTSPFGRRRFASAAEAGLHFLRRFTARLKAAPFQNNVFCGTAEAVPFPVKVKIKINVKGSDRSVRPTRAVARDR
jgi:hypothetical protein